MNIESLDEVKSIIDLHDYILRECGGKTVLTSKDVKGTYKRINPCPICGHNDHFDIYEETNSYCSRSGCCNGGTIIDFLIEYKRLSKAEAIKIAKDIAGATDNKPYKKEKQQIPECKDIVEAEIKDFTFLIDEVHKNINQTDYFINRGFSMDLINQYKLGYHKDGFTYMIYMSKGLLNETNKVANRELFESYKYFIPCFDAIGQCIYFISRREDTIPLPGWMKDQKNVKTHNLKGITPVFFNHRYIENTSLCGEYIFLFEGWADALTVEEIGFNGIAIHSANNANKLLKLIEQCKGTLKDKTFIIVGDNDEAGTTMNNKLLTGLKKLNLKAAVYKIKDYKDLNEWLIKDKEGLKNTINDFISSIKKIEPTTSAVNFDTAIFEQNNCYCKWVGKGDSVKLKEITDFIIEPTELLEFESGQILSVLIKTKSGKSFKRQITVEALMSGHQKFKKELNSLLIFDGKDSDLEDIKRLLMSKYYKTKKGVENTGFHKNENDEWIFVNSNKVIDNTFTEIDDVVMIDTRKMLDTTLLEHDPITKDELLLIAPHLFHFNTLGKTSVVLGSAVSMFLKERLWSLDISFPHLMLVGERGSGKTQTLSYIIKPILGINPRANSENVGGITDFALKTISRSSNFTPIILEEYKGTVRIGLQKLLDFFRNTYDRNTTKTGNKDKTLDIYTPIAPIVLVGEIGVEEGATIERSLKVSFAKKYFTKENTKSFDTLMKHRKLLNKFGRSLLEIALNISDDELLDTYLSLKENINEMIEDTRVRSNVACGILGLFLIDKVFKNLGLTMEKHINTTKAELVKEFVSTTFYDLLNGSKKSKTNVDTTIETFDTMALNGLLIKDCDFKIKGNLLYLDLNKNYDNFLKYHKQLGKVDDILPTLTQFRNQVKAKSYCINVSGSERFNSKQRRAFILDINLMLEAGIELDAFSKDGY